MSSVRKSIVQYCSGCPTQFLGVAFSTEAAQIPSTVINWLQFHRTLQYISLCEITKFSSTSFIGTSNSILATVWHLTAAPRGLWAVSEGQEMKIQFHTVFVG